MALKDDIEALLLEEAHLLDERRFDEWLALYTEDAHYWAPVSPAAVDPAVEPAIFNEPKNEMRIRVARLRQPAAHTEHPAPRACRFVTGIRVVGQGEGGVTVRSKLAMHEFRLRDYASDEHRSFHATVTHRLVQAPEGLRIAAKRVDLITSEAAVPMMPTPL